MDKGFVHIYTGDGKGKTSAAFGVALRTRMCGSKVYVGQFVKGMKYSETRLAELVDRLEVEQYGCECFIDRLPDAQDIKRADEGLERAIDVLVSDAFELVILDEIFIAHYFGLLTSEQIQEVIRAKPPRTELILTGRYCPESLFEYADLVTEMREIKHYYQQGVLSREGIDC